MSSMSTTQYTTESSNTYKGVLSMDQSRRQDSNANSSATTVDPQSATGSTTRPQEKAMHSNDTNTRFSTDHNLFVRRGMDLSRLANLTLAASPNLPSADHGTVPSSAPASEIAMSTAKSTPPSTHKRSRSDAQTSRKALPRDVGIVGTIGTILSLPPEDPEEPQRIEDTYNLDSSTFSPENTLKAPVFQIPKSRSPSPGSFHSASTSDISNKQPEGSRESLRLHEAIAADVKQDPEQAITRTEPSPTKTTVARSSRLPFKPDQAQPLSYLDYQPGIHTMAGPVPQPPRPVVGKNNMMPPPRPPRVLSATSNRTTSVINGLKETTGPDKTLQNLPKIQPLSIKPRSKLKSEKATPSHFPNENMPDLLVEKIEKRDILESSVDSIHIREGAFPPSSIFFDAEVTEHKNICQPSTLDAILTEEPDGEITQDQSGIPSELASQVSSQEAEVALKVDQPTDDPVDDTSPPSSYPSEAESNQVATSEPLSDSTLEQRRRASLPPLPHITKEPNVQPIHHISALWSDIVPTISDEAPVTISSQQKFPIKPPSKWPDAMEFRDILSMRTPAERSHAYAKKLRELSTEETGLRAWLILISRNTRERRDHSPSKYLSTQSSSRDFSKKQRHVSYGSINSEMTFPVRQDAYTATDLTPKSAEQTSLLTMTPSVPYPALAEGIGIRKRDSRIISPSDAQISLPTSPARALGGGFFSSIGRKASLRRDRPLPSTGSVRVTSPSQYNKLQQARAVRIDTTPTLPGGPRAPAKPTQRVHNFLVTKSQVQPSHGSSSIPMHIPSRSFKEQLEKLADLLPQADKDILAEYLRRTPDYDPMLAINAYLEGEKQRFMNVKTR